MAEGGSYTREQIAAWTRRVENDRRELINRLNAANSPMTTGDLNKLQELERQLNSARNISALEYYQRLAETYGHDCLANAAAPKVIEGKTSIPKTGIRHKVVPVKLSDLSPEEARELLNAMQKGLDDDKVD